MVLLRRTAGGRGRLKTVLLLATTTGYQIRSFGEAAAALGVRLVFASDRCDRLDDPWWDRAIPVRFHDETASIATVIDACSSGPPDGIVAVGDRPVVLAGHLAAAWGIPWHTAAAAAASRNKLETRRALVRAGLLIPAFRTMSLDDDPEPIVPSYPAVIKPLALSGSRGVMRVDDSDSLREAFARLVRLLRMPDVQSERDAVHEQVLIETFIPGAEFAVEGVLAHGAFQLLALFDKPDPLDGPYFEETIYVTPSRAPGAVQARIVETVAAAAHAVGLRHGPVHAECRVNDRGVYVLEVAARPIGGLCSKSLRFTAGPPPAPGVSLEEVLLRHALGEGVSRYRREDAASGVMMLPIPRRGIFRGVHGEEAARAVRGVDDIRITARPDALLVPLPEGRSYLGFIFAHADSPARAEHALREAYARLQFTIDRDLTLVS